MSNVAKTLTLAKGEVGYQESRSGGHWTNHEKYAALVPGMAWVSDQGQPWCAVFNCWLDFENGLQPNIDFPLTASCDAAAAWFKKNGRWSDLPGVGAWVFFGTPADLVHTGRVVAYDADTVTVTAGNTSMTGSREGDGVHTLTYQRRSTYVVGYGYPKNLDGIRSADPRFDQKATPTPPPPAPAPTPASKTAGAKVDQGIKDLRAAKARPGSSRARVIARALRLLSGLLRRRK